MKETTFVTCELDLKCLFDDLCLFAGCMFHSETGLKSFEHPRNEMKAMPRIDSEGVLCGANFKVDACSKVNGIPRRGSEANWALANSR